MQIQSNYFRQNLFHFNHFKFSSSISLVIYQKKCKLLREVHILNYYLKIIGKYLHLPNVCVLCQRLNASVTWKILQVEGSHLPFPLSYPTLPSFQLHQTRSVLHIIQEEATEKTKVGIPETAFQK